MKNTPEPYADNNEYLADWLEFLRHRALRVLADEPDNPMHPSTVRGRFTRQYVDPSEPHLEREQQAWNRLEARLKAHRASYKARPLGLEVLRNEGLSDHECIVLVALTVTGISEPLASQTLGSLCGGPLGMTSSELMQLLAPKSLSDWLNFRAYFTKAGRLVSGGLITVEADADADPGEFLSAWCHISKRGFRAVTGMKA